VKLINGHATQAVFSITNDEPAPLSVALIGGSLVSAEGTVLRNLTAQRYNVEIPAGAEESLTYAFATEMHPQNVRLQLAAVLEDPQGAFYTMNVYNETVSVVEPPTSFFDPQMYASVFPATAIPSS
jgi:hypothetical protein